MRRGTGLLALALLLAGCAGTAPGQQDADAEATSTESASTTPTARSQEIGVDYAHDQVSGDTGRVVVEADSAVVITISSDLADEAHLHGYDLEAELTPGEPAELRFDAAIPGVFELELHESGTVLLTLQVR